MEDPNYRVLMDYAMRALGQRAHTIFEMREKLKKRPHHTAELEEIIISRLKELKLLDDEAFIRRRIENAINFSYEGQFKIDQKLYTKGIPLEDTQLLWDSMKIDEFEVAKNALKKISKRISRAPKAQRFNKRAQFLASRGFSPSVVFELSREPSKD